jgi:hypothetical protein
MTLLPYLAGCLAVTITLLIGAYYARREPIAGRFPGLSALLLILAAVFAVVQANDTYNHANRRVSFVTPPAAKETTLELFVEEAPGRLRVTATAKLDGRQRPFRARCRIRIVPGTPEALAGPMEVVWDHKFDDVLAVDLGHLARRAWTREFELRPGVYAVKATLTELDAGPMPGTQESIGMPADDGPALALVNARVVVE